MNNPVSLKLKTLAVLTAAAGVLSVAIVESAIPGWAAAPGAQNNLRGYMMRVVAPATQPIWDKSYADKVTDQDWTNLRKAAADLTAAMATITSGGTVASEQARAKDPKWQDWSKKMSAAAAAAQKAAGGKDQMALAAAGDSLLEICEGCHMAFDPTAK